MAFSVESCHLDDLCIRVRVTLGFTRLNVPVNRVRMDNVEFYARFQGGLKKFAHGAPGCFPHCSKRNKYTPPACMAPKEEQGDMKGVQT